MIPVKDAFRIGTNFASANAPAILTGIGAVGVFSTAVLASKATLRANENILFEESDTGLDYAEFPAKRKWELVYRVYTPAAVSAVTTVLAILLSHKIGTARTAAATAALTISQQAYERYRSSVEEVVEEGQVRLIDSKVAEKRISETSNANTVVLGTGEVLCLESYSGRYFNSDIESLRKAQNDINNEILNYSGASLNDYFRAIGIEPTSMGGHLGWGDGSMIELIFNSQLTENGKPCLVVSFDREPSPKWDRIG